MGTPQTAEYYSERGNNFPELTSEENLSQATSVGFNAVCRVCGDRASGNHFGIQSCEGCKCFFRRSVRAGSQYACRGNQNCSVTKETRNRCQYCRLQKCFIVGMKKELIQEVKPWPASAVQKEVWSQPGWVPMVPLQVAPLHLPVQFGGQPGIPQVQIVQVPQPATVVSPGMATFIPETTNSSIEPPQTNTVMQPGLHRIEAQTCSQETADSHSKESHNFANKVPCSAIALEEPSSETSSSVTQTMKNTVVHQSTEKGDCNESSDDEEEHIAKESFNPHEACRTDDNPMSPTTKHLQSEDSGPPSIVPSFLPGPDINLPDFNFDGLIESHEQILQPPSQVSAPPSGGINLSQIIVSGKMSLSLLIKWLRTIPTFIQLPQSVRIKCLKYCWLDQIIYNTIFRSFISAQGGNIVLQMGIEMKSSDVNNSLLAYGVNRIMVELLGTFKSLNLDYKEFVCIRLLALFSPDAPELDSTMRNHMQRIQDQILVALEDHCSAQYPTAPNRSGKILLSIASVKSIAKELTQELEIKNAMEKANMDGDMFNHIDLD